IRPAMTGETENGRSINVTRMLLPRNSYLLTHQAAAMPNTRLSGTEMPTAINVSFSAAIASGSKMAPKKVPRPCLSPSLSTITSGSSKNSANTAQAAPISAMRPQWSGAGRCTTERGAATERLLMTDSSMGANVALQQVDQQQQDEGHHQHQYANGGRGGVVVLVELDHDQQRQDLGLHRHVAGDENHRAVLTHAPRARQGEAGQPGRYQRRHQYMTEHLEGFG